ncbi:MAG TPA: hypothetical protein VGL27_16305 [Negativicutes bacterium]|jgi:hypothetical protein
MNFKLLKELEDLKQTQENLSSQLETKIDARIKQSINDAFHDFDKFFNAKGFQVQIGKQNISASYEKLKVTLKHAIPKAPYTGCYLVFNLDSQLQENTNYDILLISKSKNRFSISYNTSEDPDEQLRQNIQQVKARMGELETRIQNFSDEAWCFRLRLKQSDTSRQIISYDSISDLLAIL